VEVSIQAVVPVSIDAFSAAKVTCGNEDNKMAIDAVLAIFPMNSSREAHYDPHDTG
jgi:hypothetical protein